MLDGATELQYKTVLTPPADYLASLASTNDGNGTDSGNVTAGKPSTLLRK